MNNIETTNRAEATGTGSSEPSLAEQVDREFEYAEERGESNLEQLQSELNEEKYMLPSSENSREDANFSNITADEKGLAFGISNQRNEPLEMTKKIEKRDEDRWEMNPASAESTDFASEPGDDPEIEQL